MSIKRLVKDITLIELLMTLVSLVVFILWGLIPLFSEYCSYQEHKEKLVEMRNELEFSGNAIVYKGLNQIEKDTLNQWPLLVHNIISQNNLEASKSEF